MRDDDKMLDLPPEYGSGVIGICDICGTRQAVIVLNKERYKLCVTDFLNKTWIKSEKKPGAPLPLYRSDRVWYSTEVTSTGTAQAILLTPTKVVRHPGVLITPDVYGITTTLLDGAIRFAREGYEVMIPDVGKTPGIGSAHHVSMRGGVRLSGGILTSGKRIAELLDLYGDALAYLRGRALVDPSKTALFGASYGGALALALAARDTRLRAVVLAYPVPTRPAELSRLVTAAMLVVLGSADRTSARSRLQIEASRTPTSSKTLVEVVAGARHDYLSRDMSAYDLQRAEATWNRIVAFMKEQLNPPPPRPPAAPPKPSVQAGADAAGTVAPVPTAPVARPPAPTSPPATPMPPAATGG